MKIKRLAGKDCKTTRGLWEEVFTEDSAQFVDYYYAEKAAANIAYVCGDAPYEAMLFRTPYSVQVYDKIKELSYIVGVATREEFRHKGRMTALLMKALEEMYVKRQPFCFLMPADPAIYEPFDFRYVYERPQWSFRDRRFPLEVLEPLIGTKKSIRLTETGLIRAPELKAAGMEEAMLKAAGMEEAMLKEAEMPPAAASRREEKADFQRKEAVDSFTEEKADLGSEEAAGSRLPEDITSDYELYSLSGWGQDPLMLRKMGAMLADFANQWLAKRYQIYVKRDLCYYERQLLEIRSQNGDIFLLMRENRIEGFFLYAREGEEIFLQEVMERQKDSFFFLEEKREKKPVIMARIVHLEEMMKLVKSPCNRTVLIEVEDPLLPRNDGFYLWELTPFGSRVTRQKESRKAEVFMTIDELAERLIQGVFLNEIV